MTIKDFTRLVTPIKDKLFRFSMRLTENVAEAEDVVQEVLIRLWNQKEELKKINNLEAWSLRLTRNLSIDKLRSKHRKPESLDGNYHLPDQGQTPQQIVESRDTMNFIRQLIQQLPEKQRLVIQLRDIEGMSYKEIGDILNISMNQVKVNLFRARKQLKHQLSLMDIGSEKRIL